MADFSFLAGHKVELYKAAWCGDCRNLDRALAGKGMRFDVVDIESVPGAAEKLEAETGKRAIPFLLIDGRTWVRGYHKELPSRLDLGLLERELRAAVAL
jgi:glutaredoxin